MTEEKYTPPEIWLDLRVAKTIPTEADPVPGKSQVRYFSADRVKELVSMARGGPEFIVQVEVDPNDGRVYSLSNYGRLFYLAFAPEGLTDPEWQEVSGPDLGANDV